jgi:hypothetical protein
MFAMLDDGNKAAADMKMLGNVAPGDAALKHGPYLAYLRVCELTRAGMGMPSAILPVAHVLSRGPADQVRGPHAVLDIARMPDHMIVRDGPVVKLVTELVRGVVLTPAYEGGIPISRDTIPEPATLCRTTGDVRPEAIFDRAVRSYEATTRAELLVRMFGNFDGLATVGAGADNRHCQSPQQIGRATSVPPLRGFVMPHYSMGEHDMSEKPETPEKPAIDHSKWRHPIEPVPTWLQPAPESEAEPAPEPEPAKTPEPKAPSVPRREPAPKKAS